MFGKMFSHTFSNIDVSKTVRAVAILAMVLASVLLGRVPLNAQTVTGIVKNSSGEPQVGALVRVGSADPGLTFLVVSQAQGRYRTPNLKPGKYTVQGFGGLLQSAPSGPVEVKSGAEAKMDVVLANPRKTPPPPEKIMSDADYAKLMPDGDGKRLLLSRCVICHSTDERVGPRRTSREEWQKTVTKMGLLLRERRVPVTDDEEKAMVDYLAKNFGPDNPPYRERHTPDPNEHFPAKLLQGTEAKYVAMELDLRALAGAFDIAVDSQGIAWVSEEKRGAGMLGRFDPKTLTYTRIAVPPGKVPRGLGAIAVDSQDHVWLADNNPNFQLFEYNPKAQQFTAYDMPVGPAGTGADINTIRFLDGNVWGTGTTSGRLVKLDPRTRKTTVFPVNQGSLPYGMAVGGDKMIWYVGSYDRAVIRLDPSTGKITPYKVPIRGYLLRRMGADAEGNLWVGALEASKLLKVEYATGKITEFSPPTPNAGPRCIDVDLKRNRIWFNEHGADKMGRFDPTTNTYAEFPLPNVENDGRRIQVDPSNPNRVWWDARIGRIGYVEVLE